MISNCILSAGYRHIDTASCYENEHVVGEALSKVFSNGVSREDLFITTKCYVGETHDPKAAIKRSLKKL